MVSSRFLRKNMTQVFPVIHHLNDQLTLDQAAIAYDAGAHGVFLISHYNQDSDLLPLAYILKRRHKFKVGINFLSNSVLYAAQCASEDCLDMIWGDKCGVSSLGLDETGIKLQEWSKANPTIDVFASVAFKYQKAEPNPALAAVNALQAGFIPTTSGSGTGCAPTTSKIENMSGATNGVLAIASGMTVENVDAFKPYLSHILVATGVSIDDHNFDAAKLKDFIQKVKA